MPQFGSNQNKHKWQKSAHELIQALIRDIISLWNFESGCCEVLPRSFIFPDDMVGCFSPVLILSCVSRTNFPSIFIIWSINPFTSICRSQQPTSVQPANNMFDLWRSGQSCWFGLPALITAIVIHWLFFTLLPHVMVTRGGKTHLQACDSSAFKQMYLVNYTERLQYGHMNYGIWKHRRHATHHADGLFALFAPDLWLDPPFLESCSQ